jgi:methylmalonyl-CoA/ethylmalonyl-CoA epimerase
LTVRLSHIAIACPKIEEAARRLNALGLEIENIRGVPSEKVLTGFVRTSVSDEFRIELLEPHGEGSPIQGFLSKHAQGGMHHLCFEVDDIDFWMKKIERAGLRVLEPGIRHGVRGKVLFIHPKDMGGVLIELEENGVAAV